jgi:hypothetical protein
MLYHEAIANAISKIQQNTNRPVRLICNVDKKSVTVKVKVRGRWRTMDEIYGFDNVSHLEIETFILGSIENAQDEE